MEDLKKVIFERTLSCCDYLEDLREKTILVTGATGLIGSYLCGFLDYVNSKYNLSLKIIACARSKEKFDTYNYKNVFYCHYNLDDDIVYNDKVDYVIHAAAPTQSAFFVSNPVETINYTVLSCKTIFEYCAKKSVLGVVFISSMEVYGVCCDDKLLDEDSYYPIDITNVRNSYSECKRLIECLCCSYWKEFNLPVKITRLCQTFGPNIDLNDKRAFADFAISAALGNNIVLHTNGDTKRSYCSIPDCINGILLVLLRGKPGVPYNVASQNSYISILDLAHYFASLRDVDVVVDVKTNTPYLPTIKFGLNTKRLELLGFKSVMSVFESCDLLVRDLLIRKLDN